MAMRKDFLGRGWKFPFQFDASSGAVSVSEYEQNIKECLTLILGTKPGERQMLPEFGCRIHEMMFAPNSLATSQLISMHVENAVKRWEPRVVVLSVDAWPEPGGTVRVKINYKVKTTQSEQGLDLLLNPGG
ncbi:MAG: baseplate protein [Deltaproteobacteria bacterium]|nr:MAG: baseplate protein [Deltaproteobacteria bacterium]